MAVYLLKYRQPAGNPRKRYASARYYCGSSANVWTLKLRIEQHRSGTWVELHIPNAAPPALPKWFHDKGIEFDVVRVWPLKGKKFERRLKGEGHFERHDPTVNEKLRLKLQRENDEKYYQIDFAILPY